MNDAHDSPQDFPFETDLKNELIGLGLADPKSLITFDRPQGRRRARANGNVRWNVFADGRPSVSIKGYPPASTIDLELVKTTQKSLGEIGAFRTPLVIHTWQKEDWFFLMEEHIQDGLELGILVETGLVTQEEAKEIQGGILKAIFEQHPLGNEACLSEKNHLLDTIKRSFLPFDQRKRLHIWIEGNFNLIAHRPILSTRDIIPSNILRVPSGLEGEHEWWLVDFDLSCKTSLFWFDVLRASRLSPWKISYWNDSWGSPDSVLLEALSRLLEWDLQLRAGHEDTQGSGYDPLLQAAVDSWDAIYGHAQAAIRLNQKPPPASERELFQIFWGDGSGFEEAKSQTISWASDGIFAERRLNIPNGTQIHEIRIDPAGDICSFELISVAIEVDGSYLQLPVHEGKCSADAVEIPLGPGTLIVCTGKDPQIVLSTNIQETKIDSVKIIGCKHRGIDRSTGEKAAQKLHRFTNELSELIKAGEISHRAEVARERQIRLHTVSQEREVARKALHEARIADENRLAANARADRAEHYATTLNAEYLMAGERAQMAEQLAKRAEESRIVDSERAHIAEQRTLQALEDLRIANEKALASGQEAGNCREAMTAAIERAQFAEKQAQQAEMAMTVANHRATDAETKYSQLLERAHCAEKTIAKLEARQEALQEKIQRSEADRDRMQIEVNNLNAHIQGILGSWSWRMTAPLRSAKNITLRKKP